VKTSVLVLAALLVSGSTLACDKPTPPNLPDPDTAVTAQMVKAKNEIKSFIATAEAYLKCIESSDDTADYNSMVEEMQAAADEFNTIVRQYKSRMAG
jgi:hypothetical protein